MKMFAKQIGSKKVARMEMISIDALCTDHATAVNNDLVYEKSSVDNKPQDTHL